LTPTTARDYNPAKKGVRNENYTHSPNSANNGVTYSLSLFFYNIPNNFTVGDTGSDPIVRGKPVMLIDDVATSGTILDAGVVALKSAGASSVWGLVLAREV